MFESRINGNDSHDFELAIKELGELLGYSAESPGGNGTPDAIWYIGDRYIITFEAKSSQKPTGSISKEDVQQSNGHLNWVKTNRPYKNAELIPVILSHRNSLHKDAFPHTEELRYVSIHDIRELAKSVVNLYRKIRPFATTIAPEKIKEMILPDVTEKKVDPLTMTQRLSSKFIKDMPILD